jgi:copper(I)-binding protein
MYSKMKKLNLSQILLSVFTLFVLGSLTSQANESDKITATKGYVRASIPGTTISSAYMTLTNNSENKVTLLGVSSKISPRIELHQHSMKDGMMRMRQVSEIEIDANSNVILQPHGLHLMIFDLNELLLPNTVFDITLHFSNDQNLAIQLPVR